MGAAFRYNAGVIGVGAVVSSKYRLLRLVGDGGMGSVYEAVHEVLGTRVAIKVLHPELSRRTGLIDRFLQEARVAAQIRSPHVVQVTDVERTHDGVAYIVMELLQGEPLSSVLERQRKLAIVTACEYTRQILDALEAAHAFGVTHRDLKPENVFVTFVGGRPVLKLIDFGIAKLRSAEAGAKSLTVAGVMMGTAEYMAPEQAFSADRADARSDIYAVGVMLYEMIAGVRPVDGDGDARVIATRVERGEVRPLVHLVPEVPRELAGLVHRAMAARPELRFATATEMRIALERVPLTPNGARVATKPTGAAPDEPSMADAPAGQGTMLGAPVASVFTPAPSPAPSMHGEPPTRTGLGTGTVLGAMPPVEAVFPMTPPPPMGPSAMGHPQGAYGPPMGQGYGPPPHHAPHPHASHHAPHPHAHPGHAAPARRRSGGGWWWLVVPLFLGVGAVVAVVVIRLQSDDGGSGAGLPTATSPVATQPTVGTATTGAGAVTTGEPTAFATLPPLGTTAAPPATARPTATTRPSASTAPSTAPSSTTAQPFPSTLPFPLPSVSGIPSTFPTEFPSGFPFPPPLPPPASS